MGYVKDITEIIAQLEAGLSELRELVKKQKREENGYDENVERMRPEELLDMPGFLMGGQAPASAWDEMDAEEQASLEEFARLLHEGRERRARNDKVYDLAVRTAEAEQDLEISMIKLSAAIAEFAESRQRSMPAASRIVLAAAAVYEAAGLLDDLEEQKEEVIYK